MTNVEVLSATIAHAEEAKHELKNKSEETKKDDMASPPPPPPPPPSEHKQTNPETKHGAHDEALEPETLAIAPEANANLADKPVTPEKKVVGFLAKVAPEPVEDIKAAENCEVGLEPETVVQDHEDKVEKSVGEEEKGSEEAKFEKKEN